MKSTVFVPAPIPVYDLANTTSPIPVYNFANTGIRFRKYRGRYFLKELGRFEVEIEDSKNKNTTVKHINGNKNTTAAKINTMHAMQLQQQNKAFSKDKLFCFINYLYN